MRSLLDREVNIIARNARYKTLLHRAAGTPMSPSRSAEVDSRDKWDMLDISKSHGCSSTHRANVNARQQNHWALLGLSACSGQLGIVKPLVERGADVLAVNGEIGRASCRERVSPYV